MISILDFSDLSDHHVAHEAHQQHTQYIVVEEGLINSDCEQLANNETDDEPEQRSTTVDLIISILSLISIILHRWNRA